MRMLLLSAVVCSCLVCHGQEKFLVHKHWIGESAEAFLAEEPGVASAVADCKAIRSNPQPWVEKDDPNYLLGISNPKHPTEADLASVRRDIDLVLTKHGCPQLEQAFLLGKSASIDRLSGFDQIYGALAGEPLTTWYFDNGSLRKIVVAFRVASYKDVLSDVSQRFGAKPTEEGGDSMQNGFGAMWKNNSALWLSPELHCSLDEDNNPAAHSLMLTVESRADFDKKIADFRSRPKPLD